MQNQCTIDFNPHPAAEEILESVLETLDEEYIRQKIEDPIDKAVAHFSFPQKIPLTYPEFLQYTAEFVRHIYVQGLALSVELTSEQALTEAVALLECGYRGIGAQGFVAAVLDGMTPESGSLEQVLARLAEFIKADRKEKYLRWIFAVHIQCCDWATKCRLVELVFQRFGDLLPENL